MPLPYPIIEARFQMLDASIAKAAASATSKHVRLNASDALRETVRQTRKPSRRTPASVHAIPRPTMTMTTTTKSPSNDRRRSNQYEATHRRLSMAAAHAHPLVPSAPQPLLHTWGESTASADAKEARLHAVAQETWAVIEQGLQSARPSTANAASTPTRPLSRGTKAKSAGATRGSLASSTSRHQLEQAQSNACASPHATAWQSDAEDSDNDEPEIDEPEVESRRIPSMVVRRPPPTIRKPSSKQLLRSGLAGSSSRKLPRNWLENAGARKVMSPRRPPRQVPIPVQSTTVALPETAPPAVEVPEPVDRMANIHDACFYLLEIRLEHSSSLAGWTFRVIVTDITATDRPHILISNMTCNEAHCILFLDPSTKAFTTLFNPLLYFDHVTSPIELYDHSLHIQVISESPIQKPIVDTYVHYTVGPDDTTPLPDLEPLQLELDATIPAPPCSTLDNSAYIYANHFEARTASSPTKPIAPLIQKAPQTPLEARKNELQRMRQSMRNELLLEQQRLSLSLR